MNPGSIIYFLSNTTATMSCMPCQGVKEYLKACYLNFTWFSMVAMNGEEGNRRFYNMKEQGKL